MRGLNTIFLGILVLNVQSVFSYVQINGIIDFQVPYSISEQLHAGLCHVEQILKNNLNFDQASQVQSQLIDLSQLSQKISKAHSFDHVYRDDCATLQAIIDRIDALLVILQSDDVDQEQQAFIQENRRLLDCLRVKIVN